MADMDPILELAESYDLIVIEDACQAHGAEYFSRKHKRWMRAGSMGRAAAFSFYPGKNLGACGEGGAVTTNDAVLAGKVRMLRDHGQVKKYHHDLEGYNGRLDALQAGILLAKLTYLDGWNTLRRERAAQYNSLLDRTDDIVVPFEPSWSRAVYHLYVIRTRYREAMVGHLNSEGIGSGLHYPVPLHLQKSYALLNYRHADYCVAETVSEEIISLPMYPQLTPEDLARVAAEIATFCLKASGSRVGVETVSLASAEQPA
jgi:dTDP-4-amino-4,6-dideoxygalactose transaminase